MNVNLASAWSVQVNSIGESGDADPEEEDDPNSPPLEGWRVAPGWSPRSKAAAGGEPNSLDGSHPPRSKAAAGGEPDSPDRSPPPRSKAAKDGEPDSETQPDPSTTAAGIMREIMDKAEAKAAERAEKIIGEAREKAASILVDTREQAQEERRRAQLEGYDDGVKTGLSDGHERGYAKGYEEGMAEGRRAFDRKIQDDDDALRSVINEISHEWDGARDEIEDGIADLSLAIVKKVLNPTESGAKDIFEPLIRNALRQMRTDKKITIRVSQNEYMRFFSSGMVVYELEGGATATASVIEDLSLKDGDCIIDAGDETVNAGVDSQLRYIRLAMDGARD